jgi:epoxyqueuosine reductase
MGNSGDKDFLPQLREWSEGEDEVLAESARWALCKITDSAKDRSTET